ncbi:HNH endonuclease signature motif containing protein [Roseateles sp.]|uniref:HNH endonuclease signature motif containing protein n=1 Tax=Roseateles sp. TaxID=1971397 RepID=UPI0025EF347D|nr:HNH endonuclease signature motif containing protein [Roseateles sp.]MBV8037359.1 HNH endonuclease [Roseateles sp.]
MAKPISQFFAGLDFPLRNIRWSWGAKNASGTALLLRAWADEYSFKAKTVAVLREPERYLQSDSFGLDERIVQLQELWTGALAGYVVIATAKDAAAHPREIKDYRDDALFAIKRLSVREDGAIVAEVNELVPVATLSQHMAAHRTEASADAFPVDDAQRTGLSTDTYQQKIPAIRAWLIEVCKAKGTVTYSDVMNRFGLTFYPLRNALSRLGHDCKNAGEPIITALIVDKDTGRCSQGLYDEFNIDDDILERQRCYARWGSAQEPPPAESQAAEPPDDAEDAPDDFEQRAARFAQVEVRTQQAAFRLAVFRACLGRCVISGCAVPEALEAAHLLGRDWRQGHNTASDGILLRRDLHTLYDRGLLRITDAGIVELDERVLGHYGGLHGVNVTSVGTLANSI